MKKFVDIRVVGNKEELSNFLLLCSLIESMGRYGMSRKIEVHMDGDGSGKLGFSYITELGEKEEITTFSLDDMHKIEEMKKKFEVWIGE